MGNLLFQKLFAHHQNADRPFLQFQDGSSLSHAEFMASVARFAHQLQHMGLEANDRLAVIATKTPETLILYAATIAVGCVFLPLNPSYTDSELAYFIQDSEAKICIGASKARNGVSMQEFVQSSLEQPERFTPISRDPSDLAALMYSSGTTGRSKGAMLSQQNLLSNAESLVKLWQFQQSDVLLHALPIFHTHGLFVATNVMLLCGGRMIFIEKFDVDTVLRQLPYATTMMGVPTFYSRLLEDQSFTQQLCANMRLFISGSAPLLAQTHDAFAVRTGHRILERYGMTETNMITSNPYDGARIAGTVGMPLQDVEVIITDKGAILPKGETGMIEVRGPNVFCGYWKMPEKNRTELRDNGFFITGDLGKIDEQGYVHIVGREKDLIISGGFNIYPKEIENILDSLPNIVESAVIGVPHPDLGEVAVALLVCHNNPDLDAIHHGLKQEIALYKQPRKYITLELLPKNIMGKVQKNILRENYRKLYL